MKAEVFGEVKRLNNQLRTACIVLLTTAAVLVSACGSAGQAPAVKLDSGATNENYQGVAQPNVPKQLKLTDDELKHGIKKYPVKSRTGQVLVPEIKVEDKPAQIQQPGGGDLAKPQV
jgi:apolipoprotein N-acyltransferase